MPYTILHGDALDMLATLPDASVHCCVTSPRGKDGRFRQGHAYSPATQFQPGQHWRPHKAFRDRDWLTREYVERKRSAAEIGREFGVRDAAIFFWLTKHEIPRRSISEARKAKHWGSEGVANPMFGVTGSRNPHWKGGVTPLRQSLYASAEWKKVCRLVRKRDDACLLCGSGGRFHYHHIVPFSAAPLLALFTPNVCRLCIDCHHNINGKEKRYMKRLQRIVAEKEVPVR
jgi:hypothetical protein